MIGFDLHANGSFVAKLALREGAEERLTHDRRVVRDVATALRSAVGEDVDPIRDRGTDERVNTDTGEYDPETGIYLHQELPLPVENDTATEWLRWYERRLDNMTVPPARVRSTKVWKTRRPTKVNKSKQWQQARNRHRRARRQRHRRLCRQLPSKKNYEPKPTLPLTMVLADLDRRTPEEVAISEERARRVLLRLQRRQELKTWYGEEVFADPDCLLCTHNLPHTSDGLTELKGIFEPEVVVQAA